MKRLISVILIVIVFAILFIFANLLVRPKYETNLIEGSLIRDYYESTKDHQVIILGDCEVYANYSPMEMYKQDGIKAYVRGSSQQMLWQSYYILKETLNYETPELVVFSVGALRNGMEKNNEAYNRLAIDYMKWSKEKVDIINASMRDDESFLSYVFPILRYHDRIVELTKEDIDYLIKTETVSYNGFIMNKEVMSVGNLPVRRKLSSYKFDEVNLEYLDKIVKLCKENNIKLLLVKSPSLYPYWYDEYDEFVVNYANEKNIDYLNLLDLVDVIGIDFSKDTYDGGLHLNLSGAIKNTKYFSNYIKNKYNLKDYSGDSKYDKLLLNYEKIK
ncbi:MAG: hypothetical protein J1F35_04570 [Erysipelotrichales bacterium]|nr:hypothetical protein [Erysipelotrichales bacterium]